MQIGDIVAKNVISLCLRIRPALDRCIEGKINYRYYLSYNSFLSCD